MTEYYDDPDEWNEGWDAAAEHHDDPEFWRVVDQLRREHGEELWTNGALAWKTSDQRPRAGEGNEERQWLGRGQRRDLHGHLYDFDVRLSGAELDEIEHLAKESRAAEYLVRGLGALDENAEHLLDLREHGALRHQDGIDLVGTFSIRNMDLKDVMQAAREESGDPYTIPLLRGALAERIAALFAQAV